MADERDSKQTLGFEAQEAMRFIHRAQEDETIKKALDAAYAEGAKVTLEQIAKIGSEAGFRFYPDDFSTAMRAVVRARFQAGELDLADLVAANDPPESSCAKGCLSYTKTWHPNSRVRTGIILPPEL